MTLRTCTLPAAMLALLAAHGTAHAQRAAENAVASADDAFGSSVGLETTGIYNDRDTRGFGPAEAGNARIDGIYYDPVGNLSGRLREANLIRVGFSAEDYPFNAPTGIADYRFRRFPKEQGISVGAHRAAFGGDILDLDVRLLLLGGKLAITGGPAHAYLPQTDGAENHSWGWTFRPILRTGGVEFAPFVARAWFTGEHTHPLVVVSSGPVPELPRQRVYLGQKWARGHNDADHYGATLKASITPALSLRAGLFRSVSKRHERYTEIFSIIGTSPLANHLLIADPRQDVSATSGEALFALRLGSGRWSHRLLAGFRARDRRTDSGGSDIRNFGTVRLGDLDPEPEPVFGFGRVNAGRVQQSALMLGYFGKLDGLGHVNLGVQKARYRGSQRDGRTGLTTTQRDAPWLYNAVVSAELAPRLSAYLGTERGLEDSGVAPENALNRAEQLPATRTRQFEGGLRWKLGKMQAVVSAFEITKAYFSYDLSRRFVRSGSVRHRGVEGSLSGQVGKRLSMVAGAVLIAPRVSGSAVTAGIVGKRATGTPGLRGRLDLNYRTDLMGGLTPTLAANYLGRRAVTSAPVAGGHQTMLPGSTTIDIGARQQFKIGKVPASVRAVLNNALDKKAWRVAAANTLFPDERRRFTLTMTADF
jgi:iron complex outermembrane recepter protein